MATTANACYLGAGKRCTFIKDTDTHLICKSETGSQIDILEVRRLFWQHGMTCVSCGQPDNLDWNDAHSELEQPRHHLGITAFTKSRLCFGNNVSCDMMELMVALNKYQRCSLLIAAVVPPATVSQLLRSNVPIPSRPLK